MTSRMLVAAALIAVGLAAVCAGTVAKPTGWTITDLHVDPPGFSDTAGVDINNRGQVVLLSIKQTRAGHSYGVARSVVWLWQNGKVRKVGSFVGGVRVALNDRSQIMMGRIRGTVLWENGRTTHINQFEAVALNNRGQLVGQIGGADSGWDQAGVWKQGRLTRLGALSEVCGNPAAARGAACPASPTHATAINERGEIVGRGLQILRSGRPVEHAFLWQNGKMRDLGTLGRDRSEATDINDRGQIVGWSTTADGKGHAFLWQHGKMRDLGEFVGSRVAINAHGQVVATILENVFVWQDGKVTDLGRGQAVAINDAGQILGNSCRRGSDPVFLCPQVVWTPTQRS